jgi:hypothetical protein
MVTAPGFCAMGLDTSIVAEIVAAVTFFAAHKWLLRHDLPIEYTVSDYS